MRFVGFQPPWGDLVERCQDSPVKVGWAQGARGQRIPCLAATLAADPHGSLPLSPVVQRWLVFPLWLWEAAWYKPRCAAAALPARLSLQLCTRKRSAPQQLPPPPTHTPTPTHRPTLLYTRAAPTM